MGRDDFFLEIRAIYMKIPRTPRGKFLIFFSPHPDDDRQVVYNRSARGNETP